MMEEVFRKLDFTKLGELREPQNPKEAEAAFLGIMHLMKQADLHPTHVIEVLGFLTDMAPLQKDANWFSNIVSGVKDQGNRLYQGARGAAAGYTHPAAVGGAIDFAQQHQPLVNALANHDWAGAIQQGMGMAGEGIHHFYNWATSPGVVQKWAPYAISGLGSLAAAKMMGASTPTALAAGVAGGAAGGRVLTGQPLIPQQFRQQAGQWFDQAKKTVQQNPMVQGIQQRIQGNTNNAAAQLQTPH